MQLTRNPLGLARALNEIASDPQPLRSANRATAHLFIANPLKGKKLKESAGLFDTHPPIQQRIAILLEMAHAGPDALTRSRQGYAGEGDAGGPETPTATSGPQVWPPAVPGHAAPPAPLVLPGAASAPPGGAHHSPPPPPVVPS